MSDVIKMKWHLNDAFKDRSPKKCITFHDGDFYIKDDEKSGCEALLLETVSDTDSLFHIINPNLKQIALFKVDKCFFGSKPDHKRCDCIVFDDVFFCFLELKYDSVSDLAITVLANRLDAVNQLRATAKFFKAGLNDNYLGRNLEAYVCTPNFYPDKGTWLDEYVLEFIEDYGINIFETNDKTF